MFRADRGGLPPYNPYPAANQAPIAPTPDIQKSKESPCSLEHATVAKTTACSGISEAFPWAWTWFQVLRGPEEVRTGREVQGTPGGHIGPVTGDWADDRGA